MIKDDNGDQYTHRMFTIYINEERAVQSKLNEFAINLKLTASSIEHQIDFLLWIEANIFNVASN